MDKTSKIFLLVILFIITAFLVFFNSCSVFFVVYPGSIVYKDWNTLLVFLCPGIFFLIISVLGIRELLKSIKNDKK